MFEALPASLTATPSWARAITSALLLHVVLIGVAVTSTASSGMSAAQVARDTIRLDLAIVEERHEKATPLAPPPRMPAAPSLPIDPTVSPKLEPPQLRFDGPITAVSPAAAQLPSLSTSSDPTDSSPSLFRPTEVDELPQLLTDVHPEYPHALQHAGVSGAVEVEYVVGKNGRIDAGSLRVLTTDHAEFTRSVLQTLKSARFKAARRAGQPVAVLVRQCIRFRSETP
jgi:TonB family protein